MIAGSAFSLAQPPGGGRRGGPGGGGRADDSFAQRLVTLDEDNDGALSVKELPEHMQQYFATSDHDNDGRLKGDEVKSLASKLGRDRMKPDEESVPNNDVSEVPRGAGPAMRSGPGRAGPGMRGGPGGEQPSPADFVARALTFDGNKDGSLDQEELLKFAEDMVARRGPGPGGPATGRPGPGGPAAGSSRQGAGGAGRPGGSGGRGSGGRGSGGGRGGPLDGSRPARPPQE